MIITRKALSRRTFLRGAGTAVALPFLDAMAPAMPANKIPGKTPVRMAFVYVPNGTVSANRRRRRRPGSMSPRRATTGGSPVATSRS